MKPSPMRLSVSHTNTALRSRGPGSLGLLLRTNPLRACETQADQRGSVRSLFSRLFDHESPLEATAVMPTGTNRASIGASPAAYEKKHRRRVRNATAVGGKPRERKHHLGRATQEPKAMMQQVQLLPGAFAFTENMDGGQTNGLGLQPGKGPVKSGHRAVPGSIRTITPCNPHA